MPVGHARGAYEKPRTRTALRRWNSLLDDLQGYLAVAPWRTATAHDVALWAGYSAATNYHRYFPNLETAVLALAARERAAGRELPDQIEAIVNLITIETTRDTGPESPP